ncbi:MAG: LON peptidase substrate-binding domain-containing protein [Planctomycetaceae bacterium]
MSREFPTGQQRSSAATICPLFLTPHLVVFPQCLQVIHLREQAHRDFLHQCAQSSQMFAMGLADSGNVHPGFSATHNYGSPWHSTATLTRIVHHESLATGRHMLIVQGEQRVRVLQDDASSSGWQLVKVETLNDFSPKLPQIDRHHRSQELLAAASRLLPAPWQQRLLEQVSIRTADLGLLCDLLSQSLPLSVDSRKQLLDEIDTDQRSDILLASLRHLIRLRRDTPHTFPPPFGSN